MKTVGKIALFVGGTLFGSAGLKLLGSKDARKVYSHVTAAALRCKDQVMRDVDTVQENCSDILADAKQINADREKAAEAAFIEDSADGGSGTSFIEDSAAGAAFAEKCADNAAGAAFDEEGAQG